MRSFSALLDLILQEKGNNGDRMPDFIYSNKNKHFRFAKSLKIKKYRDLTNHFLIEGVKIMEEAMSLDGGLSMAFISSKHIGDQEINNISNICKDKNIPIYQVDGRIFKELAETESTQGIIGIVKKSEYQLNNLLKRSILKLIILEEIQDPGNLGTIIRTADACNYDCVILTKGCVDLYNSKTIRATMGSLFHLPIITNTDIFKLLNLLKDNDVLIIGSGVRNGIPSYDMDFKIKFALIIGNESAGLSDPVLNMIDKKVNIPMPGRAESLNASIAAAILMYESIRRNDK